MNDGELYALRLRRIAESLDRVSRLASLAATWLRFTAVATTADEAREKLEGSIVFVLDAQKQSLEVMEEMEFICERLGMPLSPGSDASGSTDDGEGVPGGRSDMPPIRSAIVTSQPECSNV